MQVPPCHAIYSTALPWVTLNDIDVNIDGRVTELGQYCQLDDMCCTLTIMALLSSCWCFYVHILDTVAFKCRIGYIFVPCA